MFAQKDSFAKQYLASLATLQQFVEEAVRDGLAEHEVELELFRQLMRLGNQLLGEFFQRQGTGDVGTELRLPDGRVVYRLDETHTRPLMTIFGQFTLNRTVYGTEERQKIEAVPLDARLQLPECKFSHLLQSWTQLLATEQPYASVLRVFETIFQLRQHVDSLERTSRRMSADAEQFTWTLPVPPASEEGELLVESADGKGVPIRGESHERPISRHEHRPGPKPDRKRMATVGAVYSVDRFPRTATEVLQALFRDPQAHHADHQHERPRPQHKWSYARLDDRPDQPDPVQGQAATFGWLDEQLRRRLKRRRQPVTVICIMDGQSSLWDFKSRLQPDLMTVDILDLLHVTSRLWKAARLFHPKDDRGAERFMYEQTERILHGRVSTVIHSLRARATRRGLSRPAKAKLEEICRYFENNRERMRYDEYLAAGYPIASGVIEGACRHIINDRLERTGMTWTRPGAQAMLNLRAIATCGHWDGFTEYRVARETARLYPYLETLNTLEWPVAA